MPDKHEVGGSSPLEPTNFSSELEKLPITYSLFTIHLILKRGDKRKRVEDKETFIENRIKSKRTDN